MDLLDYLSTLNYAILFMELIFDIIIILFVVISVLLIYSLLIVSIESKSFEIGVMRMMGLSTNGLILMIVL
jgi:ABC-type antimicrobial peptide transport system permease subunit